MPQPYHRSFARAYERMWTDFADEAAPRVLAYYQGTRLGAKKAPVLDLCCGTGTLALRFLAEGYRVVGIDLSEPMLEIAREKAKRWIAKQRAEFILACVTRFETDEQFGLAVSTFDSLNHLESLEELEACFVRVYAALEKGGRFVFDLNTEKALRHWSEVTVDDDEEALVVKRGGFDQRTGRAFYKVSGMMRAKDGRYDRFEELVVETAFKIAAARKRLLKVGFISAYPARYFELSREVMAPEEMDRVALVATK